MVVKNVCEECGADLRNVDKINNTVIYQCPKCKRIETMYKAPPRLFDCDIGGMR